MTNHARSILLIMALVVLAWAGLRGCRPDDVAAAGRPMRGLLAPVQTMTPTATVALPTATDFPTQVPVPTDVPVCAVLTHWAAPPGSFAVIEARRFGSSGSWSPFMVIREQWPLPAVPLYAEYEYLVSWPGPTATIWPTPRDTRTPEPTQTARVVEVEVTRVVVVTATPGPRWHIRLPLVVRRR